MTDPIEYVVARGQVNVYEIIWMTGHIERVLARQVDYPDAGWTASPGAGPSRVRLQAEIDGRWTLTLSAREEDIRTMRLVTDGEPLPIEPAN